MYSMKYVPVSEFILFTMVTPVVTLILSWLLWGEVLSATELIGGSTILIGVALPIISAIRDGEYNDTPQQPLGPARTDRLI